MNKKYLFCLASLFAACLMTMHTTVYAQKYVGGDISNLTSNEAKNPTYYDNDRNSVSDPLQLFKSKEMNAMRVRLHVNPSDYDYSDKDPNACQDLEYVKVLGKRIKDAGFKLMLDFHYSDTWADPAKQWTPKRWINLSDTELYAKIHEYTKDALLQLKEAGAEPDFIQTGNEISYGMLWGDKEGSNLKKCFMGSDENWSRFTTLLSHAGKACREICPNAKIIIHTERAAQTDVMTNFYDKMKAAQIDYDIIGLSYYPVWHNTISVFETALNTLESKYPDKDIMVVEVGYAYSWEYKGDYNPYGTYPATEAGQKAFLDDFITMLNKHDKVTGLFWWGMDYNAYPWDTTRMDDWWYAPLIDSNTGKPLAAMSSLKDFLQGSASVESIEVETADNSLWYTVSGQPAGLYPSKPGLYIRKGKKMFISK